MYTVYVLYSELHHKLYIGYTSNLIERFRSHQTLGTKGYTKVYRPWKVIHVKHFEAKVNAQIEERKLKGGQGRAYIKEVILPTMKRVGFISA